MPPLNLADNPSARPYDLLVDDPSIPNGKKSHYQEEDHQEEDF